MKLLSDGRTLEWSQGGSWEIAEGGGRLCTGETCNQTPITVYTTGLLPIPSHPWEGVLPADCEPRRVCSCDLGVGGVDPVPVIWGDFWVLIR